MSKDMKVEAVIDSKVTAAMTATSSASIAAPTDSTANKSSSGNTAGMMRFVAVEYLGC